MESKPAPSRIEILGVPGVRNFAGLGCRPIRIGTSPECEVRLSGRAEGVFALIIRDGERWLIAEASSDAGVHLNGARIFQSPLSHGDRVTILGASLEVRMPTEPANGSATRQAADAELDRAVKQYPVLAKIGVTLVRTLHRGASGVFFKARWSKQPSAPVMVKLIAKHLAGDEEAMFRFCRGVTAAGDLRHPHVLRLFRAGKAGDGWYLISELAGGGSLRDRCSATAAPLSPRARARMAVKVGVEIARALEAVSDAGLMHRGVTPSSVLFDDRGSAKLGDFALVRGEELATMRRFTMAGDSVGEHAFMGPEQALGSTNLDVRADLYALGAVMYYAAVGKPPVEGANLVELVDAICRRKPAPPSSCNQAIPAALDQVILKALAKDPGDRFRSATEFRSAVESLLAT